MFGIFNKKGLEIKKEGGFWRMIHEPSDTLISAFPVTSYEELEEGFFHFYERLLPLTNWKKRKAFQYLKERHDIEKYEQFEKIYHEFLVWRENQIQIISQKTEELKLEEEFLTIPKGAKTDVITIQDKEIQVLKTKKYNGLVVVPLSDEFAGIYHVPSEKLISIQCNAEIALGVVDALEVWPWNRKNACDILFLTLSVVRSLLATQKHPVYEEENFISERDINKGYQALKHTLKEIQQMKLFHDITQKEMF